MRLIDEGKFAEAIELLEKRRKLEPNNENNVIVTAYCYVERNNAIRAARTIQDFLVSRPGKEDAQNALGAALQHVDNWNEAYWSFARFYKDYDAALARARHDGAKRWGAQWLDAAVADSNWQRVERAEEEFNSAMTDSQKTGHLLRELLQQRADAAHRVAIFRAPDIAGFDREINLASARLASDNRGIQEARAVIRASQPHFPPIKDRLD